MQYSISVAGASSSISKLIGVHDVKLVPQRGKIILPLWVVLKMGT